MCEANLFETSDHVIPQTPWSIFCFVLFFFCLWFLGLWDLCLGACDPRL